MAKIEQVKLVQQTVAVGWVCDVCYSQASDSDQYRQEWISVDSGHQGWGSDSVDSYDHHDVCSVECFVELLRERLPLLLPYADHQAEIAGMPAKFAQKLLDRLSGDK